MATKYWIKLWHEILDDPKMGRLPDNLWRRFIMCCLLAGELDQGGILPSLEDMSWRFRMEAAELLSELEQLDRLGLISHSVGAPLEDGTWLVVNFEKRQRPMPKAEYMRRLRKKQPSYQSVTETVTIGNTEEEEETDTETDTDQKKRKKRATPAFPYKEYIEFELRAGEDQWLGEAARLLETVCGPLGTAAYDQLGTVASLINKYGLDQATEAMKSCYGKWVKTRSQATGKFYSGTNYAGIVDWTVQLLNTGVNPWGEEPARVEETKEQRDKRIEIAKRMI